MVDKTPNLELNYIYSNQAQKEISVNEAFTTLDAVWNNGAISKSVSTPPLSPALADLYIVGTAPTGAWAGKAKNLAYYNNGWKFITPKEGITIWVNDEDAQYTFDGINWVSSTGGLASVATDGTTIEGNGTILTPVKLKDIQPKIGINTSADTTNKLAVASEAILFNNIGNGTQVKLNKNAASDTASFLYQNNFSGRAEIGLTGDDDFHFKVSPNGTSWNDAIIINKTSGDVSLNSHKITNLANPTATQDAATKSYVDANIGSSAWGSITGTLSSQTDLQTALNAKQNTITTGTISQYFRGDLSLATFPTALSSFTNDSGYITSTALTPYLLSSTASSTYFTIASAAGKVDDTGDILNGGYARTLTTLTDAAPIALNLATNNFYRVVLGGNRTLANPTNKPASGDRQVIILEVVQDGTGGRTLAFDTDYVLSVTPVLNSGANAVTHITLIATDTSIFVVGYA